MRNRWGAGRANVDVVQLMDGDEPDGTVAGTEVGKAPSGVAADPVVLELYQLAVEMADRLSARRVLADTFFLTLNTGLAALLGEQISALVRRRRRDSVRGGLVVAAAAQLPPAQRCEVCGDQCDRGPSAAAVVLGRVAISAPGCSLGWPRSLSVFQGVARGIPRVGWVRARGTAGVRRHLRR